MTKLGRIWRNQEGQDVAEYAIMLAVVLVVALGATAFIRTNTNQVFSKLSDFMSQL